MHQIVNKILQEWSYRVDSGMPDIENPLHMVTLEESLRNLNLPTRFINGLLSNLRKETADKYTGIHGNPPKGKRAVNPDPPPKYKYSYDGKGADGGDDDTSGAPEFKAGEEYYEAKMPPMTGHNSSQKEIQTKIAKVQEKVENIKDQDKKDAAKESLDLLEKYGNSKTYKEKIEVLKEMKESGLIQRNNRGSKTKKIYFSGDTGLFYKEFGQNSALHREIAILDEKRFEETGEGLLETKERSKAYGKKAMAPNKVITNEPRKVPVSKNTKTGTVTIGNNPGTTMKPMPDTDDPKVEAKLREVYTVDGEFNEEEYNRAKIAIKRHNRLVEEVEKVIAAGGGELECVDPLPGTDPSTETGRHDIMNATANAIADKFYKLSGKGKNLSKSQQLILDKFNALKRPPLDQKEYEEKLLDLADDIQNDVDLSAGYADLVETLSYMRHLNRGSVAFLPSAGNFPLGDVLTFPNNESQPDWEKDSASELANKMKAVSLSVDNRSIKKGTGGASSTHTKVSLTEMVDMIVNDKRIKAKEVKSDQLWLSDKGYDEIFGVKGNKNAVPPIKKHVSTISEVQAAHDKVAAQAKKYGVDITSDKHKAEREKRVLSSLGKVIEMKIEAGELPKDWKPPPPPPLPKPPKLSEYHFMKAKHEAYYDLGKVQADVHNRQLEIGATQLYSNEVWKTDKNGRTATSETNGIDCLAFIKFEFGAGWLRSGNPNNKVPSRFNNKDKAGNPC